MATDFFLEKKFSYDFKNWNDISLVLWKKKIWNLRKIILSIVFFVIEFFLIIASYYFLKKDWIFINYLHYCRFLPIIKKKNLISINHGFFRGKYSLQLYYFQQLFVYKTYLIFQHLWLSLRKWEINIKNSKMLLSEYESVKIYWLSVKFDWFKYLKSCYCKSVKFYWLLQWKLTDLTVKIFFPLIQSVIINWLKSEIYFFTGESVKRQITYSIGENLTDSDLESGVWFIFFE